MPSIHHSRLLVKQITEILSQQFHNAPLTLWNDIDGPRSPKLKRFFPYKRNCGLRRLETTSVDKEKPLRSISGCLMKLMPLIERLSDTPCPKPHCNNLLLETHLGLKLGQVKVDTLLSHPSSPSSHNQFLPLAMMTEDQPSENVLLLMRISSPGDVPVSSNELNLSLGSTKSLTCLMIGHPIPHSSSAKFSCHPNVQTFPQISGSTLLRDRLSTSQRFLGLTIQQRSKPNCPMTLETCSSSPFKFPNSLKPLKLTATGMSPLEKQSKPLPMPYQPIILNTLSIRVTSPNSLHPSNPSTTDESLTSTKPFGFIRPIKNTYASIILPNSTTSALSTSLNMVWVQTPHKGVLASLDEEVNGLPILGAETPAITGIEAPVTELHQNAHTSMSATVMGAGELIDDPTVQSQRLNRRLSERPWCYAKATNAGRGFSEGGTHEETLCPQDQEGESRR